MRLSSVLKNTVDSVLFFSFRNLVCLLYYSSVCFVRPAVCVDSIFTKTSSSHHTLLLACEVGWLWNYSRRCYHLIFIINNIAGIIIIYSPSSEDVSLFTSSIIIGI